jgi:hypothetical protein
VLAGDLLHCGLIVAPFISCLILQRCEHIQCPIIEYLLLRARRFHWFRSRQIDWIRLSLILHYLTIDSEQISDLGEVKKSCTRSCHSPATSIQSRKDFSANWHSQIACFSKQTN